MRTLAALALVIIALCQIANTVAVYESDDGGTNVFFGNVGYHFEGEAL